MIETQTRASNPRSPEAVPGRPPKQAPAPAPEERTGPPGHVESAPDQILPDELERTGPPG